MKVDNRILMITGSDPNKRDDFLNKIKLHIDKGTRLIQFRAKELNKDEYISLAKDILKIGKKFNTKIILNTDIEIVEMLNADGIHLSSKLLEKINKRPLSDKKIVSAACHNLTQLQHAELIGVDFVTLSPVYQTKTHPDAIPLGWSLFSDLCKIINIPIYALGGLSESDLDVAISHGAFGIAAISSLWDKKY